VLAESLTLRGGKLLEQEPTSFPNVGVGAMVEGFAKTLLSAKKAIDKKKKIDFIID
jgi:hypothetical protein